MLEDGNVKSRKRSNIQVNTEERWMEEVDEMMQERKSETIIRWPSEMKKHDNYNWFIVPFFYLILGLYLALPSLAIQYYAKEVLKIGPSALSMVTGVIMSPWFAKPLFGLVSDSRKLWNYHRKSYLLVCSAGAAATWFILSMPGVHNEHMGVFGFLMFVSNLFICVCDVMVDCMLAKEAREEAHLGDSRGKAQSMAWFLRHGGSFLGSCGGAFGMGYLGEQTETKGYIQRIFFVTALFPVALFVASFWLYEEVTKAEENKGIWERLKRTWNAQTHRSMVLRLALFIFIYAATPTSSQAVFYFLVNKLGFSKQVIGNLDIIGVLASMGGLLLYRVFFHEVRTKVLIAMGIAIGTVISLTQVLLINGTTKCLGMSDVWFAASDDVASSFASQLTLMPLLVAAATVCPSGDEGLMYAGLMSVSNFGGAMSMWGGAALTRAFGVTAYEFARLKWLVVVCSLLNLVPLLVVWLIPAKCDEKQGAVEEK